MRKTILICVVITAFVCGVRSGEKRQKDYVRFFAGVAMLRSGGNLSPDSTAVFYRDLSALCGVTTEDAVEFLEKSKKDPVEWRKFNELVMTAVTERFNTE